MDVEKTETTMTETFNNQGECHVFCLVCLVQWCRVKADCPVCKTEIKSFKDDNGKVIRVPQDLDKIMKKAVRRRHRRHRHRRRRPRNAPRTA